MRLIFLHGWSVTSTDTYGSLPEILRERAPAAGLTLDLVDLHLGRYISFRNEVRMDDVVRALHHALHETLADGRGGIQPFSCITHSTGGPVLRCWMQAFYGTDRLAECPLEKLIMLAPANHGSPLAILGASRLGRLKAWFEGIEPGDGMLRWLELGSEEARVLNHAWLTFRPTASGSRVRPFVLTGTTIDKKLYDHVNSYTGEPGSDGVVRAAGANLDYSWLSLRQENETLSMTGGGTATRLVYERALRVSEPCPFLIVPGASHSGGNLGILRSPTLANADEKPVVTAILEALAVSSNAQYADLSQTWSRATESHQTGPGRHRRFFQLIVRVTDDRGSAVTDFDFILLGGPRYDPDKLPKGFLLDKQSNRRSPQTVSFYLDFDAMMAVKGNFFGFRVLARPSSGFAWYQPAEFHSTSEQIDTFVDPNTTLYLDITLKRRVDRETARLDPAAQGPMNFNRIPPSGIPVR